MNTGKELARETAQEILKPHWPVVHNMEENEARQKEVERIESALVRYAAQQRLEEAKWWRDNWTTAQKQGRITSLEREAESLGATKGA